MNMSLKKRFILSILFAVFSLGVLYFSAKTYAGNGEMSVGSGALIVQDENGNDVRRQFTFHARRDRSGTVSGQAILHNPAYSGANGQNYKLVLDISCMKTYGNTTVFGGLTKRTNDPNLVDAAYFTVQDNGEPGKNLDKISLVYFFDDDPTTTGDPQLCEQIGAGDLALLTIDGGNIQVFP